MRLMDSQEMFRKSLVEQTALFSSMQLPPRFRLRALQGLLALDGKSLQSTMNRRLLQGYSTLGLKSTTEQNRTLRCSPHHARLRRSHQPLLAPCILLRCFGPKRMPHGLFVEP